MQRQLICDDPEEFLWQRPESPIQTLVYGEKHVPIKSLHIERKIIPSYRTDWIEQNFTVVIGFDDAMRLFFTESFAEHFFEKTISAKRTVIYDAKVSVIRKIYYDFEARLHSLEFSVFETGMKLHAHEVGTNESCFPLKTFDLLIHGTFEF